MCQVIFHHLSLNALGADPIQFVGFHPSKRSLISPPLQPLRLESQYAFYLSPSNALRTHSWNVFNFCSQRNRGTDETLMLPLYQLLFISLIKSQHSKHLVLTNYRERETSNGVAENFWFLPMPALRNNLLRTPNNLTSSAATTAAAATARNLDDDWMKRRRLQRVIWRKTSKGTSTTN